MNENLADEFGKAIEESNRAAAQKKIDGESFEWCTDCKEYDREAHCCHRFTNVIRRTIDEMQIVKCVECKWFQCVPLHGYSPHFPAKFWCNHWGDLCNPTDYCSYGEIKEEAKRETE